MNKTTLIVALCGLGLSAQQLKDYTYTELFALYCEKTSIDFINYD